MSQPPKRKRRPVDGILLFDKPLGMSSNQALQRVKFLYQAEKAGHTGSLDPLATGLLPICLGEATKYAQHLLDSDKVYQARLRLGQRTTTADAEGEIVQERPVSNLTPAAIEAVLARFRGDILQVPSMFSALKHEGRPLYELARKGIEIAREPRQVRIHRLVLLEQGMTEWAIEVACSKGTYIRNLVEDIGEALGCGAHVTSLRRLATGPFALAPGRTLEDIIRLEADGGLPALDALLLPPWAALAHVPRATLSQNQAYYILHGNPVQAGGLPDAPEYLLFEGEDRFLGLGYRNADGLLAPRRLMRTQ